MDGGSLRTLDWAGGPDGVVEMVDQTALPGAYTVLRIDNVPDMVAAIQRLSVRGAPAIGVAGAFGVALAVRAHGAAVRAHGASGPGRRPAFDAAVASLRQARPTAVNLARTALAVIQTLHERGQLAEALALETRPLLQGARLTAWELDRMGAPTACWSIRPVRSCWRGVRPTWSSPATTGVAANGAPKMGNVLAGPRRPTFIVVLDLDADTPDGAGRPRHPRSCPWPACQPPPTAGQSRLVTPAELSPRRNRPE